MHQIGNGGAAYPGLAFLCCAIAPGQVTIARMMNWAGRHQAKLQAGQIPLGVRLDAAHGPSVAHPHFTWFETWAKRSQYVPFHFMYCICLPDHGRKDFWISYMRISCKDQPWAKRCCVSVYGGGNIIYSIYNFICISPCWTRSTFLSSDMWSMFLMPITSFVIQEPKCVALGIGEMALKSFSVLMLSILFLHSEVSHPLSRSIKDILLTMPKLMDKTT